MRSLQSFNTNTSTTANITCGGFITHILVDCGLQEDFPNSRATYLLTKEALQHSRWLSRHSRTWLTHAHEPIPIPFHNLPPLDPNLPSYCFPPPGGHPDPIPETQPRRNVRRRAPTDHEPPLDPTNLDLMNLLLDNQQNIRANTRALHSNMQAIRQNTQQIQYLQQGIYPIYDHFHRHHLLPPNYVHPPWYHPPATTDPDQPTHGSFFSTFETGGTSGHGNGNDEDDGEEENAEEADEDDEDDEEEDD